MQINNLRWMTAVGVSVAVLTASGCETTGNGSRAAREVALAEFSHAPQRSQHRDRVEAADEPDAVAEAPDTPARERGEASPDASSPLPRLGAGTEPDEDLWFGPEPGTRLIVDSLVGQINGRPIYADSFFEPIKDQLRAIARRTTQREFLEQAQEVISQHLWQIVQNELFLADARSQLTREQQQGLFAWMRAMREQEILAGGGTQSAAARRLEEQHGMTMEEYLAARRDGALLQKLREERIRPRVIVSWRDIEREYQRRFHEFNPPATMKVSRIRLSTERDAEMIEFVREQLDAGTPFDEIAAEVGVADGGAWQQFQIGEEGVDGLQLSENIRRYLRDLQVGQTSDSFEIGASTWWLHVAEIIQPKGRSLYDPEVQRMLHDAIENRRLNQELNRYMQSLIADGVEEKLDKMRERLLIIAYERYGPA